MKGRLHKGNGVSPWKPVPRRSSKPEEPSASPKNECENKTGFVTRKSVFTLIRTDTTLDLSHKAEKVCDIICASLRGVTKYRINRGKYRKPDSEQGIL